MVGECEERAPWCYPLRDSRLVESSSPQRVNQDAITRGTRDRVQSAFDRYYTPISPSIVDVSKKLLLVTTHVPTFVRHEIRKF